jgi:hypothetical protein
LGLSPIRAPLWQAVPLPENIRLGWKRIAVANAQAYYNTATIKAGAANIRQGWKGLAGTKTLAYYKN